uniref:Uncharacterized protein n=1 Tax=Lotharella globosa TaxID=91324 RepID=A0A7S3Z7L3_9EUKA|mmetsp:Transcript_10493/g.20253  ORF Transcript_10493/g.20253 Transcript_10493/m.20253 type:complete len:194 (+) Transcript_10493:55-636(+)
MIFRAPALRVSMAAKRFPVIAAGISIGMRYGVGDGVVQLMSGQEWDTQRNLMFGAFGATYAMTLGYGIFNVLYPKILPRIGPFLNAVVDAVVFCPFVYFPVYYIFREVAYSPPEKRWREPLDTMRMGLESWRSNIASDAKACAAFWIPMNTLNFWAVPLHLRQPYIGGVGFLWAMILSKLSGGRGDKKKQLTS